MHSVVLPERRKEEKTSFWWEAESDQGLHWHNIPRMNCLISIASSFIFADFCMLFPADSVKQQYLQVRESAAFPWSFHCVFLRIHTGESFGCLRYFTGLTPKMTTCHKSWGLVKMPHRKKNTDKFQNNQSYENMAGSVTDHGRLCHL